MFGPKLTDVHANIKCSGKLYTLRREGVIGSEKWLSECSKIVFVDANHDCSWFGSNSNRDKTIRQEATLHTKAAVRIGKPTVCLLWWQRCTPGLINMTDMNAEVGCFS